MPSWRLYANQSSSHIRIQPQAGGGGRGLSSLFENLQRRTQVQPLGQQAPPPIGGGGARGGPANLGTNIEQLLTMFGAERGFSHRLGESINGVAANFFAPSPDSPIPPHVQRRLMRFCTKYPDHFGCRNHPEWNMRGQRLPPPPTVGGAAGGANLDLNEMVGV